MIILLMTFIGFSFMHTLLNMSSVLLLLLYVLSNDIHQAKAASFNSCVAQKMNN